MAGRFYPADPRQCRGLSDQLLANARLAIAELLPETGPQERPFGIGALLPHAGWICSGAIAAEAIAALARSRPQVDLVVIFGAIHTPISVDRGVLDSHVRWALPGAACDIATELREGLAGQRQSFIVDDRFHEAEHAVEVELPLIRSAWPGAKILPVETPPLLEAIEMGRIVARAVKASGMSAVYLASTDLTHYGLAYNFAPVGVGLHAMEWALENDRRVLQVVSNMQPEKIISEAESHKNACGAGALAAMMAASMEVGATQAKVLRHASSFQTLASVAPQPPENSVGYAAVWVG